MAMMPPTITVAAASAPTVMMPTTAAPHMAVTMTVAALDLDDSSIGAAESIRCCSEQIQPRLPCPAQALHRRGTVTDLHAGGP
jgi:hypothetical protein